MAATPPTCPIKTPPLRGMHLRFFIRMNASSDKSSQCRTIVTSIWPFYSTTMSVFPQDSNKTVTIHAWHLLYLGWPTCSFVALCLWITASVIHARFFHRLALFPGPFSASFTNLWKVYHVYVGDLEHVLLEAHRKHGKIVRIGPNHLDFSDASAVKAIYGSGRAFTKRYIVASNLDKRLGLSAQRVDRGM